MERLSKIRWCLIGCAIAVLMFITASVFIPDKLINVVHWVTESDFSSGLRVSSDHQLAEDNTLVEMVVDSVTVSELPHIAVVILKERDGDLYLPIFIGLLEATAIAVTLDEIEMPRPLTSDLAVSIMSMTGTKVSHVIIRDFQDDIFYATIVVDLYWMQANVDARPSDAIAIALRVEAPVYVKKSVLDATAIQPEHDTW